MCEHQRELPIAGHGSKDKAHDLGRLWQRCVARDVAPAFTRAGMDVHVRIFRDDNADQFTAERFPGVQFCDNGPGMRAHNEFYDAALNIECDFLFFLGSDTFFFDADWAAGYFEAFDGPNTAAVSLVPRKGRPAVFALLCRMETFRALPAAVFAWRYEFPKDWPNGVDLENGDAAVRELVKRGQKIVNVGEHESAQHAANFRSSTALRATRGIFTRSAGEWAFEACIVQHRAFFVPAHDNVLLGSLYEAVFGESFAPGSAGTPLGGSVTLEDLRRAIGSIHDAREVNKLRERFRKSRRAVLRMANREGVTIGVPCVLPDERVAGRFEGTRAAQS